MIPMKRHIRKNILCGPEVTSCSVWTCVKAKGRTPKNASGVHQATSPGDGHWAMLNGSSHGKSVCSECRHYTSIE